jgi:uncharacterized membrane protein (UPF0136 family)
LKIEKALKCTYHTYKFLICHILTLVQSFIEMGGSAHISFSAGAAVLAGGFYAYVKKGSKASLIASSVIGGALVVGGVLILNGNDYLGHTVSLVSSSGLSAFGLYRIITTKKVFPAVPLFLLGTAVGLYQAKKVTEWA